MLALHKKAKKIGLDLNKYNDLKREIAEIEYDLKRLRDPLYKDLTITPPKSATYSMTEIESAKKLKALLTEGQQFLGKGGNKLEDLLESVTKRLKKK